jgi:hypothetical protein
VIANQHGSLIENRRSPGLITRSEASDDTSIFLRPGAH